MAEPQATIRKVDWPSVLPWLILFRSVRIALMARVLLLGTLGLIATTAGWRAINLVFISSEDPVVKDWRTVSKTWLWENAGGIPTSISAHNAKEVFASASQGLPEAPIAVWGYFTQPFQNLFDGRIKASGFLCMLLACAWELFVWGIFGGAITRIAALKFTRDEAIGPVAALRHGFGKLPSYGLAPLIALAGAAVFAIQLVILGALMNASLFAMLVGFVWPFVLVLGLLMAILLIGALFGWPLMWATVSVEGTDAFDALSRSYAYVYQRPWRLLWYVAFSLFLAAVSMFAVKGIAIAAIRLGDWSVSWGLNDDTMHPVVAPRDPSAVKNVAPLAAPGVQINDVPPPLDSSDSDTTEPKGFLRVAWKCIGFWKSLWTALAAGYQAGFLWVSAVGIYLLLRRDIDGAEMDEVYVDQSADFGMPPLDDDTLTGVPAVSPKSAAMPGDTAIPAQRPVEPS